jgi:hypothetical protein
VDVNRAFDRQYARSESGQGEAIPRATEVDIYHPYQQGAPRLPGPKWRWRNWGYSVAPFVIIDQAGVQWDSKAGKSGRRIIFWAFGWSHPFWIRYYWIA